MIPLNRKSPSTSNILCNLNIEIRLPPLYKLHIYIFLLAIYLSPHGYVLPRDMHLI